MSQISNRTMRRAACRGLFARVDGSALVVTDNGRPFKDIVIGATLDWLSGSLTVRGTLIWRWEAGRRRKPNRWERPWFRIREMAGLINLCAVADSEDQP